MNNYDPFDAEGNDKQRKRDTRRAKRNNNRVTVKQHNPNRGNVTVRSSKQTEVFGEKKKRVNIYAILLFLFLGIYFFGGDLMWSIEEVIDKYKVNHVEVVEDYVFDPSDIDTDGLRYNYLDVKLGDGKSTSFNQDNRPLEIDKYGHYTSVLEGGNDVEPGMYTVIISGDVSVRLGDVLGSYYPYDEESITVYNVPFALEEAYEIESRDKSEDYEVQFIKQDEYKQYEDGDLGLFIYGLSNSNPSVNFEKGLDVEYTYNSSDGESVTYYPNYRDDFEAKGSPGSYFIVE